MKKLHEDLISLLADTLELKRDKAASLLTEWVVAIRNEVEHKGEYHAEGLGTFIRDEKGLVFLPDDTLAIEVNYKYAGMNPIEILPAYASKSGLVSDKDEQILSDESVKTSEHPDPADESEQNIDESEQIDDESEQIDDMVSAGEEDDPFALGDDEITDDILFGDKPATEQEESDKSADEIEPFNEGVSFDPFDESEDPFKPQDGDDQSFSDDFAESLPPVEKEEDKIKGLTEDANDKEEKSADSTDKAGKEEHAEDKEKASGVSLIGKTSGIGIRPASKPLEKSGRKSEKARKSEPTPVSSEKNAETVNELKEKVEPFESKSSGQKKKTVADSEDSSSKKIWFIPIAAASILIVMLFFHFEEQITERPQIAEPVEQTISAPAHEEGPEGMGETSAEIEEESASQEVFGLGVEDATEDDSTPFGLMGPQDEIIQGAYSIVVHSIISENRARIEKDGLVDEGYNATMWQTQLPDGRTTWRVGVGQFETVSDAEQVIPELPEPYRSNHFIVRIR